MGESMKKNRVVLVVCALALAVGAVQIFAAVTLPGGGAPVDIPDNSNVAVTLTAPGGTVSDVNLTVNITHTWNADIRLSLSSPAVATQVLWMNCGGSGDNLTDTVLDEAAVGLASCTLAGAPFSGSFQPTNGQTNSAPTPIHAAGNLGNFNGTDATGIWTLTVADDSNICTGTLNSWSLTMDGTPPLPVELTSVVVE